MGSLTENSLYEPVKLSVLVQVAAIKFYSAKSQHGNFKALYIIRSRNYRIIEKSKTNASEQHRETVKRRNCNQNEQNIGSRWAAPVLTGWGDWREESDIQQKATESWLYKHTDPKLEYLQRTDCERGEADTRLRIELSASMRSPSNLGL